MTKEQVEYLRQQLCTAGEDGTAVSNSVFYYFKNQGLAFRSSNDFIIFDSDNELIHCIAANRNNYVKDESPYTIYSTPYDQLQYTEANVTLEGLTEAVEGMFADLLSDAQKTQIKNWALALPCNPISPVIGNYIKEAGPQVNLRPLTKVSRADGVHNSYPVVGVKKSDPIKTTIASKAVESINALTEGATLAISGTDPINEAVTLDKDNVTIVGNDLPVTNNVTISGSGVTLKGIALSNDNVASGNIVKFSGENLTLDGCTLDGNADITTRTPIYGDATTYTISNCTFSGAGKYYNTIETNMKTAVKKVVIKDCVFMSAAATNNFVSLYKFEDGAEVTFENCVFHCATDSNAVRISNLTSAKNVTINFLNCRYGTEGAEGQWDGLLLFQDYTGDQDMSGITVKFTNLRSIDGATTYKDNSTNGRVWYTYSCTTEPTVIFA
jgi:hypothetical protein